jgi:hypothetical protein
MSTAGGGGRRVVPLVEAIEEVEVSDGDAVEQT